MKEKRLWEYKKRLNSSSNHTLEFTTKKYGSQIKTPEFGNMFGVEAQDLETLNAYLPRILENIDFYDKNLLNQKFYLIFKDIENDIDDLPITFDKGNSPHLLGFEYENQKKYCN